MSVCLFNVGNIISLKGPRKIAKIYYQLYKLSLKLHKTESSVGFIQKKNYNQVKPNFFKAQGHFSRVGLRKETESKLLYDHLSKHYQDLNKII